MKFILHNSVKDIEKEIRILELVQKNAKEAVDRCNEARSIIRGIPFSKEMKSLKLATLAVNAINNVGNSFSREGLDAIKRIGELKKQLKDEIEREKNLKEGKLGLRIISKK